MAKKKKSACEHFFQAAVKRKVRKVGLRTCRETKFLPGNFSIRLILGKHLFDRS